MSEQEQSGDSAPLPPRPVAVHLPREALDALERLGSGKASPFIERIQPYLTVMVLCVTASWTYFQYHAFHRVQGYLEIAETRIRLEKAQGRSLSVEQTIEAQQLDNPLGIPGVETQFLVTHTMTIRNNSETVTRIEKTDANLWIGSLSMPDDKRVVSLNFPPDGGAISWTTAEVDLHFELQGASPGGGGTAVLHPGESSYYASSYVMTAKTGDWVGVSLRLSTDKADVPLVGRRMIRLGDLASKIGDFAHQPPVTLPGAAESLTPG